MYICFAEYCITPEHRQAYLAYSAQVARQGESAPTIYEGTDQPNVFVELWTAPTEAEAEVIKQERLSEQSPWHRIKEWVEGGEAKVHVWTFRPISSAIPE
ncbi:conserved hypothetical protein [Paenibacillus curdlanolyticus YK9]|uniref:DUF1330 domain-containing protein n=1 Tax=Paenibacillus curdlanolyticus YK9 TaxID=717606 RepID=E0IFP5_9BACL|nr:hypothetical protein [Paenibacillus curdlanolyticus]EFM08711.1 conserved hypothetical protein [Paenibacillus curdlanolyticus YK9]